MSVKGNSSPGNIWQCPETFLVVTFVGKGATGIWWAESRMLLNTLQCTGQPPLNPTSENFLPQTSIVLRMRNWGRRHSGEKLRQGRF